MGLFSWFLPKLAPPPVIPTDEVPLDTEILRASAEKVLQKPGWRELGARVRRSQNGGLEYHLPKEYSEERPALMFTTETHDMSIDEHPVLCKLPKATGEPTIFEPTAASLRPYMRSPTTPQKLDDWLYNDIPQLSIHVVNFEDATTITLTMLHTLTDLMGVISFFREWLATLHGREDTILPYIGFRDQDPLENLQLGKQPPRYMFADKLLQGWNFFKFIIRDMIERFRYPDASLRFFSVPSSFVDKLTASATAELASAQKEQGLPTDRAFVTDSDVLCAWWTRLVVRQLGCAPERPVQLMNRFDSRGILAKMGLLPDSGRVTLMGNAAYNASCFTPTSRYLDDDYPLGRLAGEVRDSITAHRTVEQLQAQDAAFRDIRRSTGRPPIYGDPDMLICFFTNWYRGKLFQMDFSPAAVNRATRGDGEEKAKRVTPVFMSCTGMESRWAMRNATAILGKSNSGDWWLVSRLRRDVWEKIELELKKLK
ncbi:hypothetical protein E8E14_014722 [Neopestalotiopsis sp. 37M]|nr:hypothetical protein E8E14_014722 [Neopestalotiopsis sp. 37M]